jgi:hypothetical protein
VVKYRFRLAGVDPEHAEREIDIDPDETIAEVKEKVRRAFHLQSDLNIELIVSTPEDESEHSQERDSEPQEPDTKDF